MIYKELLHQLYNNDSPYDYIDTNKADNGYPHTNILNVVIEAILLEFEPTFWLEIGSMLGNSAIRVAECADKLGVSTDIVCIDPFTGDVNMWSWERNLIAKNEWRFLGLENGRPTIYDRFLANVKQAGYENTILPINCTSIVGINLLQRLVNERRLSEMPSVIYLDSAHEEGETYLELRKCWDSLPEGGILFGDDWDWPAVRSDVLAFFGDKPQNIDNMKRLVNRVKPLNSIGPILLYKNQWVVCK